MAIRITDECIGCGACVATCPFGALVLKDDKVAVTDACTSCGACVETCPVGAIERDDTGAKEVG